MKDYYYKVSDGNNMDFEDFLTYIIFLKQEYGDFVFDNWFCEDDFSSPDAFNYIKEILEK